MSCLLSSWQQEVSTMKVLNLFSGIGGNRKLWKNVEVTAVEIDSDVAKEYQKKGYSYEACKKIIEHCFDELNLHRIYCGTLENNEGMQKLAEKLGMVKEGQRKQAVYKNGKFVDVIEYGLVKE
jgi:RimJ/RimL family protein N-acetyltransferase